MNNDEYVPILQQNGQLLPPDAIGPRDLATVEIRNVTQAALPKILESLQEGQVVTVCKQEDK